MEFSMSSAGMRNTTVDRLEIEPSMEQVVSPRTKVVFSAMEEMKILVPRGGFAMDTLATASCIQTRVSTIGVFLPLNSLWNSVQARYAH
jgi:hypothetical protein